MSRNFFLAGLSCQNICPVDPHHQSVMKNPPTGCSALGVSEGLPGDLLTLLSLVHIFFLRETYIEYQG